MENNNSMNKPTQPNNKEFRSKRIFVLDTNVLLHDSRSLSSFKGVVVAIPFVVLEELDSFKKDPSEIGRNARYIIRKIDELRKKGNLSDGVAINNGTNSVLKIIETPKIGDDEILGDIADNLIIRTAQNLAKKGYQVTFVTKDINARVKADALGIDAEDYISKETVSTDDFYKGWTKKSLPANELRKITLNNITNVINTNQLEINEFLILESENNPENNRLFRYLGGKNF